MSYVVRGIVWFGVYVLLVLAPAAVAIVFDPFTAPRPVLVELSAALGLLVFPLLMFQFALVSRFRASSKPFGTDALVQFHQYIGIACLLLVAAHPFVLNLSGMAWSAWNPFGGSIAAQSGAAALWALVLLVGSTVYRRRLGLRYELWMELHLALSVAAASAMVFHVLAVNGYTRAAPVRYLLLAYVGAFGVMMLDYRVMRPIRLFGLPWEVAVNRDEGSSTRTLRVRPVGHDGFHFDPGQFAWLITGRTPGWSQQHPLSISSSAETARDHVIEFSIKALGDWSSDIVPTLTPGTRVWVDGPFGAFTTERKAAQGFVFIAGGIGIAPMRSMLLTMRDRCDGRHAMLIQAAHDETRLLFREELQGLRPALNLDIVYVLEAPTDPAAGEHGYVTRELLARRLPAQFRRYHYFVCGPAPMMDAVEDALIALGIPAASIDSERFHVV